MSSEEKNSRPPPGPVRAAPPVEFRGRRQISITKPTIDNYPSGSQASSDIRQLRQEYRLICQVLKPLERTFWKLEQRRVQLVDQLANKGVRPFCESALARKEGL